MNGAVQALGWALIHFCWQATAVAALYLAVSLWFKKARSQTRYLLTLATLFSMFIVSSATLGYETIRCSAKTSFQFSNSPTPALATFSSGALATHVELLANQPAHIQLAPVLPWLDFAWLLGVLCLSMRSIGGWWWLERLRRRTMEEAPEAIHATFLKACAKLGIARLPDLRISERISVPMTFGVLRSLVLLPASALLALSPDQLEAILAHELAHVRRADYFWNLIQTLAETLFFFHPAVWWIGKRLREQRELCCDDIALEMCSDPLVYATALFRLEDQRSAGLNLAMALDGHQSRSDFRARILRILGEPILQSHRRGLRPLSLIAVCASLFFLLSPLPKILGGISSQHPNEKPMLSLRETSTERAQATKLLALQASKLAGTPGDTTERQRSNADEPPPHIGAENSEEFQMSANGTSDKNIDYRSQMRAAGYDVDESQYNVMRTSGIAPEYAREMATLGFGRPSVGDLLEMKEQKITPEYVATLGAAGLELKSIDELISCRLFDITPEFIEGMKVAGYDSLPERTLQNLRALDITPEYARSVKQQFPNATLSELMQLRALHVDDNFIASAKSHGFEPLTVQKLIGLRTSGVLTNN